MFVPRMFQQDSYATLEKVAFFTEKRQRHLANNIANVATPLYKRRDLDVQDFTRTLKDAIVRSDENLNNHYDFYDGIHTSYKKNTYLDAEMQVLDKGSQLRHDENNVDIEHEMVEMAKNRMYQQFAMNMIRQKNGILAQAIRGRLA